jgi:hypothetical protein
MAGLISKLLFLVSIVWMPELACEVTTLLLIMLLEDLSLTRIYYCCPKGILNFLDRIFRKGESTLIR